LATLLVIDDSTAHRDAIREAVGPSGLFELIIEAVDGAQGLKLLLSEDVDVVLCDLEMPGFDGEQLLQVKQKSEGIREVPFVFVTGSEDPERKARLLELGAVDLISKPFHPRDLLARLNIQRRTKRLHDELRLKTETMSRLTTTDAVTGLRTRRYITEVLSIEFLRARRYGTALSVLMADLDHFKNVNDEYGHLAGDAVLNGVAGILLERVRATDVAGRYGGEEIMVILAQNDAEGGNVLAEHWRMLVEGARFPSHDGREISVQISIGVADFDPDMSSPEQLVQRADEALYKAKDGGRNQVVIYET
jgi:two-component system cell cycle response regulator